jgi:hypothetical protein
MPLYYSISQLLLFDSEQAPCIHSTIIASVYTGVIHFSHL